MKLKYQTKKIKVNGILFEDTEYSIIKTAEFIYNTSFTDQEKELIIKMIRNNKCIYLKDNNSKVHFSEYIIEKDGNFYIMNSNLFTAIFIV